MGRVAAGGEPEVERAVEAARAAFAGWSQLTASARAGWLLKIAAGIEARFEAFALTESLDTGKPLALARRMDIPRAIDNFRFFAHTGVAFHGEAYDMGETGLNYTLRRPLGPVGLISPWNLPLYLLTWKIAPALAAGNTVVAKPSELTPGTATLLGEVCQEIGLPEGVLNIVHGLGSAAGQALVAHPGIRAISFTGSTAVGRRIAQVAAGDFKKYTLEMGGKNATVVFADADFEAAVSGAARAAFTNQGQICLCGSRLLVEKSMYEPFLAAFVQKVNALTVGDPMDPATDVGAIISQTQWEKDLRYIQLAKDLGGKILTGGGPPADLPEHCRQGWYLQPTVIAGLDQGCAVNQEEIFGPIVTIEAFENEDDALAKANATPYGLAATVFTTRLDQAHRFAAHLEAGIVWVNNWLVRDLRTPFGGMKQSGVGREGGMEALHFFTEAKNVYIQL